MIIRIRPRPDDSHNDSDSIVQKKLLIGKVFDKEVKRDISMWTISGHKPQAFFYRSKLAVDADGSPFAYHPQNKGLDDLRNAGQPGNWWGIVTNNLKPSGKPVIQKEGDPAPGYYVSSTALYDRSKSPKDQNAYVNSGMIPYIVLPFEKSFGAVLGDMAIAYNVINDQWSFAVYADNYELKFGNLGIGEGSIALAKRLGINPDPRKGGTGGKANVIYVVFPKSGKGNGIIPSVGDIEETGQKLLDRWGGISILQAVKQSLAEPVRMEP
ncbi:glycoside hydrolase family 75 protein [Paenibacillus sp. FSL L8-0638]|uniref:glycoside hydrolase family 75 protein n=1 Tax=Paenibacillus TaxID=44249 RepID=UPI003158FC4B